MPACVIHYQEISFALKADILVGMIEEDLEDLGIGMTEHKRIEFSASRTDCSGRTHANVSPFVRQAYLFSLLGSPPTWAGVFFYAGLVQIRCVNV